VARRAAKLPRLPESKQGGSPVVPVRELLQLGNPDLYRICDPVSPEEVPGLIPTIVDLGDTLRDFRRRYEAGRAIAAPQIGVFKRIVFMQIDDPVALINPVLSELSEEMIELWDDCMCFPKLLVKVRRHRHCKVTWRDERWGEHSQTFSDDISELMQHEIDHLDGILAISRAIDEKSFAMRSQRDFLL
jgi:peptide deformylase